MCVPGAHGQKERRPHTPCSPQPRTRIWCPRIRAPPACRLRRARAAGYSSARAWTRSAAPRRARTCGRRVCPLSSIRRLGTACVCVCVCVCVCGRHCTTEVMDEMPIIGQRMQGKAAIAHGHTRHTLTGPRRGLPARPRVTTRSSCLGLPSALRKPWWIVCVFLGDGVFLTSKRQD